MLRPVLYFLLFMILFVSCTVQRRTRFTNDRLITGMTKSEVAAIFGKPYKESSATDTIGNMIETWYYKEQLYVGKWYEVNHVLHFENSKFKSLEQGEEYPLYKDSQVTINH